MRLYPRIVATLLCGIVCITSAGEHSYLSNFRATYHGHGATSYQNVQIENEKSVPLHVAHEIHDADAEALSDHHHKDYATFVIPIPSENLPEDHEQQSNKDSYQEIVLAHEANVHGVPEYYNSYEGGHEYEYYR